jgi:AcrR family transcriptional regulator
MPSRAAGLLIEWHSVKIPSVTAPSLRVDRLARTRPSVRARRRAPDEKREQIAAAAAALFAEYGFSATTTASIAGRAGVSEGTVFHHFGSKRDLFAAVVADYGRDIVRAMFGDDPARRPTTPRAAIEAGFAFVREHRALHRVFATSDGDLAAVVHAGTHDPIVAALEQTLAAAVSLGIAREMDTRIVAELCYALVGGALKACFTQGDGAQEALYLAETIHCAESAIGLARESRSPA